MAWIYLLLAGAFEIGWPVGLKMAQEAETRVLGIIVAIVFMAISGFLLWLAQKEIPIGTSYAIWTGIGAAGTFVVGVLFYVYKKLPFNHAIWHLFVLGGSISHYFMVLFYVIP